MVGDPPPLEMEHMSSLCLRSAFLLDLLLKKMQTPQQASARRTMRTTPRPEPKLAQWKLTRATPSLDWLMLREWSGAGGGGAGLEEGFPIPYLGASLPVKE